jgi:YHS domain-containing protein
MNNTSQQSDKDIDLVCGMEVDRSAPHAASHQGQTYYFCSMSCQEHFVNDPEKYVG